MNKRCSQIAFESTIHPEKKCKMAKVCDTYNLMYPWCSEVQRLKTEVMLHQKEILNHRQELQQLHLDVSNLMQEIKALRNTMQTSRTKKERMLPDYFS